MYLLYCDESGASGIHDYRQPFHVLGGLVVPASKWLAVERDLNARIDALVPPPRDHKWEIHMTDMVNSKGWFSGMPRETREGLCDAVLDVIDAHDLSLIMIAIDKAKLLKKYGSPDPPPEIAYRFMIERFEYHLGRQPEGAVGAIVSDDQKGQEDTIRRGHSAYRTQGTGYTVASRVIETPFFAPSHWSRMLQIVDVATWICARKLREEKKGKPVPTQWDRIKPHLDGHPAHHGRGLKVFPK
jgi:Protein of unknown function (DUF3800)